MENVTKYIFAGHDPDDVYIILACWNESGLVYADFLEKLFAFNVGDIPPRGRTFCIGYNVVDGATRKIVREAFMNSKVFITAAIIIDSEGNILYMWVGCCNSDASGLMG